MLVKDLENVFVDVLTIYNVVTGFEIESINIQTCTDEEYDVFIKKYGEYDVDYMSADYQHLTLSIKKVD